MPDVRNDYADTLTEKRILYMPSCVIVEMMTTLYSEIFAINISGDLRGVIPDILALLRRMRTNLRATADAYGDARVDFFIGDWREDKRRARRVFFNIMSHLGYISAMVGHDDRDMLYGAIEEMTAEWVALDRAMDDKATRKRGRNTVCRYFRNRRPETWKQTMANVILTLDEDADYREGEHLVLLCFERIKRLLLSTIDGIERRNGTQGKFNPDRILVVSREEIPFSCPNCLEITGASWMRAPDEEYPDVSYADAILSLRGSSCPLRPRLKQISKKEMAPDAGLSVPPPPKPKHNTIQWLKAAFTSSRK